MNLIDYRLEREWGRQLRARLERGPIPKGHAIELRCVLYRAVHIKEQRSLERPIYSVRTVQLSPNVEFFYSHDEVIYGALHQARMFFGAIPDRYQTLDRFVPRNYMWVLKEQTPEAHKIWPIVFIEDQHV